MTPPSDRPGHPPHSSARAQLRALLEPLITGAGLDLEEVDLTPAGRRRVLRVVVDGDRAPGEGLDLDAVADVSRSVSEALDSAGALGDAPYTLEVTTPGVDRPLTEPRHWRRAVSRLVATTAAGAPLTGRVLSTTDTGVRLRVEPSGEPREVEWADLGPGRVQIEFRRPSQPDGELAVDGQQDLEV
jgi:ribosome maturation factor RimP